MSGSALHSSYQRQEFGNNRVRYVVSSTPGSKATGGGAPSLGPPVIGGIVLFVLTASINFILAVILGIGAGYAFHRFRKQRAANTVAVYEFTVAPDAITAQSGTLATGDVQEVLWRDWADGGEPGTCSLYLETRQGDSALLASYLDEETASRLAADVGRLLKVSVSGGKPETAAPQTVTTLTQPMQDGDLVLAETSPGSFEIQRVDGGSRAFVTAVPAGGLIETIDFARGKAGDSNLWLEKLADGAGPPVLLSEPKSA